jgi:hypothetical protein
MITWSAAATQAINDLVHVDRIDVNDADDLKREIHEWAESMGENGFARMDFPIPNRPRWTVTAALNDGEIRGIEREMR